MANTNDPGSRTDQDPGHYRGQSGRSMHSRMAEHVQGLKSKKMTCPLYRHRLQNHKDEEDDPTFVMKKLAKPRSNMERLVTEAEVIAEDEEQGVHLWNNKSEYGRSKLIRWKPTVEYT